MSSEEYIYVQDMNEDDVNEILKQLAPDFELQDLYFLSTDGNRANRGPHMYYMRGASGLSFYKAFEVEYYKGRAHRFRYYNEDVVLTSIHNNIGYHGDYEAKNYNS